MTSARIALDIFHQPIAERDESRIVLPKRAVKEIPGPPLGHRMLNHRSETQAWMSTFSSSALARPA